MDNVLKALKHMAEHGGYWSGASYAGVWYLYLSYARSYSNADVGFTQDELRAFLEHYEELSSSTATNKELPCKESDIASFFGTWPGDETDAELLESLSNLDKPMQINPESVNALIDMVDNILTDWKSLNKPGNYQLNYNLMHGLDLIMENLDEQIRKS